MTDRIAYATFVNRELVGSVNIKQSSNPQADCRRILDKANRRYGPSNHGSDCVGGIFPDHYVVARELPFSQVNPPWLMEAAKRWITLGDPDRQITPVAIWSLEGRQWTVRSALRWQGNLCEFTTREAAQAIADAINLRNGY